MHTLKAEMVEKYECDALHRYLSECNGNITRAAKAAQISRRTFHRLLKKHGIATEDYKVSG